MKGAKARTYFPIRHVGEKFHPLATKIIDGDARRMADRFLIAHRSKTPLPVASLVVAFPCVPNADAGYLAPHPRFDPQTSPRICHILQRLDDLDDGLDAAS